MGYFNSKPLIKLDVVFDQDDGVGNIVADHIEEHLIEQGFRVELSTKHKDGGEVEVNIEYLVGTQNVIAVRELIKRVLLVAERDGIEDVFHMDNPENAAHDFYCLNTTVQDAREDEFARRVAFSRTV